MKKPKGDAGASLLIVLVFLLLVSVLVLSLLGFTQASFESSDAVRESRQSTYAADAATEYAIAKVKADPSGDVGTTYGPPCAFVVEGVNGRPSTVLCSPAPGSGVVLQNRALNALLTLSDTEPLALTGTFDLVVDGRIYSHDDITTSTSSNSFIRSTATVIAEGDGQCSAVGNNPAERVVADKGKTCRSAPTPAGVDPQWTPSVMLRPAAPLLPPQLSCLPGKAGKNDDKDLITFSPGTYVLSPVTILKTLDLAKACDEDATLYFQPGVYYLEDVTFDLGKYNVVFGRATGTWLTSKKIATPMDGTACDNGGATNTQLLLGGSSVLISDSSNDSPVLSICAGPRPTDKPAIAIHGLTSAVGGMKALSSPVSVRFGKEPSIFVHGTLYLPTSRGVISLHNRTRTVFDGGILVWALTATLNASSTQVDAPISLPACSALDPCRSDRRVVFTAAVSGGPPVLRSIMSFDDQGGATPASATTLTQWSQLP
ncbi:MAG: hypothetical protein Q8R60_14465 [Mycobacteriales bacterium]|nr:hypothetical protein [Mycobacteriales bacterium]